MSTRFVRARALLGLSLILLAAGVIRLHSQGISEDEIRFGSRPYVPPSANAIHVQTNVVQVPVVVRDSQGKAVAGLKQSDFQLFDDGHPVKIASFAVENSTSVAAANMCKRRKSLTPACRPIAPA